MQDESSRHKFTTLFRTELTTKERKGTTSFMVTAFLMNDTAQRLEQATEVPLAGFAKAIFATRVLSRVYSILRVRIFSQEHQQTSNAKKKLYTTVRCPFTHARQQRQTVATCQFNSQLHISSVASRVRADIGITRF